MHYKNGQEAHVGDIVQGKGYNLQGEFLGILTHISSGEKTCNAQVRILIRQLGSTILMESTDKIEYTQCDYLNKVNLGE